MKLVSFTKAFGREFVRRIPHILLVGLLLFIATTVNRSYNKLLDNTKDIKGIVSSLNLKDPNSALSRSNQEAKDDRNSQTLLLCTLILGQNISITGSDVPTVEDICKHKIQQFHTQQSTNVPQKPQTGPTASQPAQNSTSGNSTGSSGSSGTGTPPPQPSFGQKVKDFIKGKVKSLTGGK